MEIKTITDFLKHNYGGILTLNILDKGKLVSSQTVCFAREVEDNPDKDKYLLIGDGERSCVYISYEVLNNYKLVRLEGKMHYIFHYELGEEVK